MNRRNQIEMLSKSRQLLRLMNLGQKTQFQIGRMKIPNFVMFTLLSAPLCYSIVTESITAYEIGLNFKEGSSGFLILLGTVQMMLIYFCLVSDNQTIIEMMDLIEGVVNRRSEKSSKSLRIYQSIEDDHFALAAKVWKIRVLFIFGTCGPSAMYPIFYYFFKSPAPNNWQLALPMKIFHETETYFGFYSGLLEQFIITCNYSYWFFTFILFYIGLCSYVDALMSDLNSLAFDVNNNFKRNDPRVDPILKEMIELHNIILTFMQTIRYIMTGPLFFELSSCIIGTVCELLALDQTIQEQQIDASVFVSADALGIHVSMVYILCHFAEKLSNQSFNVTRIIYYDLVWYNLSVERQKCMVLPICRSQESFKLTGYGIFDCSMEIFLKIMRSSVSYFIIMRQLKDK